MHEYHSIEKVVGEVIQKARESKVTKVKKVKLVMGELLGFDESSVRLYFETIAEGPLFDGTQLEIKEAKAMLKCNDCGASFERRKGEFECRECSSSNLATESGKEFYVEDIEVE